VFDNFPTPNGEIPDEAIAVRIPKHVRREVLGNLDRGLLRRGFARLKCEDRGERRLGAKRSAPADTRALDGTLPKAARVSVQHRIDSSVCLR